MEVNFNYGDHAHARRGATGHRGWVTQGILNLAGSVGALEVSPRSALTRTKVNTDTSALDRAKAKANASYTFYSTMDGARTADPDAAATDQDAMNAAYTTTCNKALTVLANAEAARPTPSPAPSGSRRCGRLQERKGPEAGKATLRGHPRRRQTMGPPVRGILRAAWRRPLVRQGWPRLADQQPRQGAGGGPGSLSYLL